MDLQNLLDSLKPRKAIRKLIRDRLKFYGSGDG